MGTDAPRAPLNQSAINENSSQYWRVQVVEVTGSTQEDLAVAVTIGDAFAGDVIAAEYQRMGRGRLDRTFEAESSTALMFSFAIAPQRSKDYWSYLPLLAGIAVAESINSLNPHMSCRLKWPNDLLIGEKKLGGIIAQTVGDNVIIGIGINVEMSTDQLPVSHATSIAIEGGQNLNRNDLLATILKNFEAALRKWEAGDDMQDQYRVLSSTIGKAIEAHLPGGALKTGKALNIDHHGGLILDTGEVITSGDVIHLR